MKILKGMMTCHIDIEIYRNAYRKRNDDKIDYATQEAVTAAYKFFHKSNVVLYNVSGSNEYDLHLISDLFQGIQDKQKKPVRKENPLRDYYNELLIAGPYQVFFFKDLNNVNTTKLSSFIYAAIDNYTDVFKKALNVNYHFSVGTNNAKTKFTCWEKVLPDFPVSEIILNDNFLFKETPKAPLENNAFKLLGILAKKYTGLKKVIILSNLYKYYEDNECIKENNEIDKECIKKAVKKLKTEIKNCFASNPNIEYHLINFSKEHDRHIFTNYFFIQMSSVNNLYDKNNELITDSKTSSIYVNLYLTNHKNFEIAIELLSRLKKGFDNNRNKAYSSLLNCY